VEPDEDLYEIAMKEVATSPRTGLLAKCITLCDGDESKAKIKYIKIRVKEMKAQIAEGIKKEKAEKEARDRAKGHDWSYSPAKHYGDPAHFPWILVGLTVAVILAVILLGS